MYTSESDLTYTSIEVGIFIVGLYLLLVGGNDDARLEEKEDE